MKVGDLVQLLPWPADGDRSPWGLGMVTKLDEVSHVEVRWLNLDATSRLDKEYLELVVAAR